MAIPLKNGADLYNFEVLRMRFHNLGADPTSDFGVGQVYFNTSTSEGSGKRVRIYDGSAFRSLAYLDEFTALQTKVNAFLDGGVDADGVLENLAEIQKFLDNYSSATDLSEILDTKLDKDGGKAKNLAIVGSGTSYLAFESTDGTSFGSLGISSAHEAKFWDGTGAYTLLHSGNVGEYKSGDSDKLGGIAASSYVVSKNITSDLNATDLYGSQSFVLALHSSAQKVPSGMSSGDGIYIAGGDTGFMLLSSYTQDKLMYRRGSNSLGSNSILSNDWKTIAFTDSNVASAQALVHSNGTVGATVGSLGELCLGAKGIWSADGTQSLLEYTSTDFWVGYSMRNAQLTRLYGNRVGIYTGNTQAMFINSSGNVTIGSSDLAASNYKLYVNGVGVAFGTTDDCRIDFQRAGVNKFRAVNAGGCFSWRVNGVDNDVMVITADGKVGIGKAAPAQLLDVNGNILIPNYSSLMSRKTDGTAINLIYAGNDDLIKIGGGALPIKLQGNTTIAGDLHVTGNIIADGEVSAGGAGEEGDTGTGTGGGDALIYSQEFTPTTTSITITHNLSATKGVIVQVWEKNGNYWDMVLVDVEEVDTNTVTLFFGKTETTVHKVVIMG